MTELVVLDQLILVGTKEEINQAWKSTPAKERHRLWTEEEFDRYLLAGPEEVAKALQQKRDRPGPLWV